MDYIGAYLAHLRSLRRATATLEVYGDTLRRIDRDLQHGLAKACTDELTEWIYADGWSVATLSLYRTIVRQFFAWATDPRDPRLSWNPAALLPDAPTLPRRAPRPLTVAQLTRIIGRAAEPYRTWFLLAAYGGLRCCEIAALDREHVTEQTIWVHGKGSHEREVPTDAYVWDAVSPLPPGPVARTGDGTRASRQQVSKSANHHLRKHLGEVDVTMHRGRHTYATYVYRSHGEFVAQRLLGHASPVTTAIYAKVAPEAMAAAVAALPRLIPVPGAAAEV